MTLLCPFRPGSTLVVGDGCELVSEVVLLLGSIHLIVIYAEGFYSSNTFSKLYFYYVLKYTLTFPDTVFVFFVLRRDIAVMCRLIGHRHVSYENLAEKVAGSKQKPKVRDLHLES